MIRRLVSGAVAGAAATGVMSIVMGAAKQAGLVDKLSPRHITDSALHAVDASPRTEATANTATAVAHLGYGVAMGSLYSVLAGRRANPVTGVAFGLAIAAASYQGWVPAAGILPSFTDMPSGRRASLLASHVVYGAVLGAVAGRG